MNELSEVLLRQASQVQPMPDITDVHERAQRHRRRARAVRLVVTAFAVVAIVIGLFTVTRLRTSSDTVPLAPPPEVQMSDVGGLVITGAGADMSPGHFTLERVDPHATSGPFAIVVRRGDGRLGSGSAVVSYPIENVDQPDGEIRTVTSNGTDFSTVVFSRPGGQILVRSAALTVDEINGIAAATQVIGARPVVRLPSSMGNFAAVASGTIRPPLIREARYRCDAFGEGATLLALCYTGLTSSPGFEAALYSRGYQPGPTVLGHPSFVSTIGGGNATLAWEPRPGIVAYVGYSGLQLAATQIEALARLAQRSNLISQADWAATQPQVIEQPNNW